MIKNLVLKGGGVLAIAYAGAIRELEYKGVLKGIERVAGTSAGAITACLIALKFTGQEIQDIVNNTDFKSFQDRENPARLLTKYGMYSGDTFLEWMEAQIIKKGLPAKIIFSELAIKGFLDLNVFATDLNERGLKRFSAAETPNTIVSEAIRASMSIPFFFKAHRFSNSNPDNHIYVDGGTVYNYPLTVFDSGSANKETLGLFLTNLSGKNPVHELEFDHIIKFIRALANTALDAQNINMANDIDELERTIMIDNLGISATNFNINSADKIALFTSGINAIKNSNKF